MTEQMTAVQFQREATALAKKVGPAAQILAYCSARASLEKDQALTASVYDGSVRPDAIFRVDADDFEELLRKLEAKWSEYEVTHRERMVRKIALAIIRITADQGSCSEAALRVEFDRADIERYGADAVQDANEIADRGPFAILKSATANAA